MNTNKKFLVVVAVFGFLTFIQQATIWVFPKLFLSAAALSAVTYLFFQKDDEPTAEILQ